LRWPEGLTARLRVGEAALLLIVARLLIMCVRFGVWRPWLGQMVNTACRPATTPPMVTWGLVTAVERAQQRLHYPFKCLPRAMALQWMLARRGISTTLLIGVARGEAMGQLHDLHAWVEVNGTTVIGTDPSRVYARVLALASVG